MLLREFARWLDRRKRELGGKAPTQGVIGLELEVSQQTAGRFIKWLEGRAGDPSFGYAAATRIARAAGYRGVDHLFEVRGMAESGEVESAAADGADECPNRVMALRRLSGLLSHDVVERVRAEALGPTGDYPEVEWCRIALEAQLRHDRFRVYDGPKTPPPAGSASRRKRARGTG